MYYSSAGLYLNQSFFIFVVHFPYFPVWGETSAEWALVSPAEEKFLARIFVDLGQEIHRCRARLGRSGKC